MLLACIGAIFLLSQLDWYASITTYRASDKRAEKAHLLRIHHGTDEKPLNSPSRVSRTCSLPHARAAR